MSPNNKESKSFPSDFRWGAATAAFQIEGHPEEYEKKLSDWSLWLDAKDSQGRDRVIKPDNRGKAVDHFNHMSEDIGFRREMNLNSYRFSFNWAAIHRAPGEFDQKTIDFYKKMLSELKGDIEPFATLVHFVLPEWLAKDGGWENPNTATEFKNFTAKLVQEFGASIKKWITHNEPNIFLWFGYESGIWPPGYQNDWTRYLKAYQGILLSHKLAYETIKEKYPDSEVGIAQNLFAFEPFSAFQGGNSKKSNDMVPLLIREKIHNWLFIENCVEMDCLDFLGINYYTRLNYEFNPEAKDLAEPSLESCIWGQAQDLKDLYPASIKTNDLNWEVYPDGLEELLLSPKLKELLGDKAIYITENGYCHIEAGGPKKGYSTFVADGAEERGDPEAEKDLNDYYRIEFIKGHLGAVHKAINEGVNVQGYFYWSLLDNFEWALGMQPRFGLVHVNHDDFSRTLKESGKYYARIAESNSL